MSTNKVEPFLIDTRIVQRNINAGRIERKAYEEHLSSLKDLSEELVDIGEKVFAEGKTKVSLSGDFNKEDKDYE